MSKFHLRDCMPGKAWEPEHTCYLDNQNREGPHRNMKKLSEKKTLSPLNRMLLLLHMDDRQIMKIKIINRSFILHNMWDGSIAER